MEVVGCTFQTLGSEGCKKGGAMSFELKWAVVQLKKMNVGVENSICSSSEGCGGGINLTCATDNNDRHSFSEIRVGGNTVYHGKDMFIVVNDPKKNVRKTALNCLDDPEHSDAPSSEKAKALPIKFRLIRFSLNRASVEKDLFIICLSIAEQINEALFVMDFSELAFDKENAIYGMDKENEDPIDLVPFIVFYKSERIFVSGEKGKNKKDCGRREDPCETLSEAVRHLNDEPYQNVLVVKKAAVSTETAISSATVQTVGGSPAVFEFNSEIAQTDGSADCVVSSSEECSILGMDIVFGPSFASAHRSVFGVRSGNLTLGDCTITSEEPAQLANTVICVDSHSLCLSNVSFSDIRLKESRQQPSAEAFVAKQFAKSSSLSSLSLFEPEAGY